MINKKYVKDLFANLETNSEIFFSQVSNQVDWTVEGHHPLAGRSWYSPIHR